MWCSMSPSNSDWAIPAHPSCTKNWRTDSASKWESAARSKLCAMKCLRYERPKAWSATNSIATLGDANIAAELSVGAPQWPQLGGCVKLSAAWLVEQAGFAKGFTLDGRAALSSKHTLALTNRGDASAEDVMALARRIQHEVQERFAIALQIEPQLVGDFR